MCTGTSFFGLIELRLFRPRRDREVWAIDPTCRAASRDQKQSYPPSASRNRSRNGTCVDFNLRLATLSEKKQA